MAAENMENRQQGKLDLPSKMKLSVKVNHLYCMCRKHWAQQQYDSILQWQYMAFLSFL